MDLAAPIEERRGRARAAAVLGAVSTLLLAAALRWSHHWSALADSIVAAWALATLGTLGLSIWSLATSAQRLAKLGLALACVSLLALAIAGLALAAGMDPACACGGG